ncbi:MAG: hypothetical protein HGA86_00895, partial [Anaerolineaceae bacterium]|nr:hypothetical protein [Anaerolineaceae bacterium]
MDQDPIDQTLEQNNTTPANSPASRSEQIQELVTALVSNYQQANRAKPGKRLSTVLPGRDLPGKDLAMYEAWLAEAHRYFREASKHEVSLTYASEWVLDNYYIIRQALKQIQEDLPSGYFRQLPRLSSGPLKDYPRIYAVARAVLSYQHLLLDPIELQTVLIQYQEHVPLTMGELWALPIFLRYGLIEFLSHALVAAIRPPDLPRLPAAAPLLPGVENPVFALENGVGETANNDRISNIILSLRTISEQNWSDFFESVCKLEHTLQRDPAGIYAQMDFKTRDLYRKEIEELSFATGRDENELAEITVNLAGATNSDDPLLARPITHVGDYLIGRGRPALEQFIAYKPDMKTALKRWVVRHAGGFYLSITGLMVVLIFTILFFAARLPALTGSADLPWDMAKSFWGVPVLSIAVFLLLFALFIPVLTVTTSLVNWLITLLVRPRSLPKLDFKEEIPEPFHALIVIPSMITSHHEIDSLTNQIELHYLRNPEPGLLFGLLTDFRDGDTETRPEDDELVAYATASIEQLNAKYNCPAPGSENEAASGDGQEKTDLFYFFHRKRLWNPQEKKWIGWERKRGKLHELNLFLRGHQDLTFTTLTDEMYASGSPLQRIRFVITLDTETILPRGGACRLAGTLAHPLNQAVFDEKT